MNGFRELGQLKADISELVDPGNCLVDNIPGKKALVPYDYTTQPDGDNVSMTVTRMLPGFECTSPKGVCGATWQDSRIRNRFLEAAALGLARLGDSTLHRYLSERHLPLEQRVASRDRRQAVNTP